ncbi:small ribosomal subunit biogenesis GTPase RsgA [Bermanella marisrubri]|uniref:Small ribosomal subunit biogenesis GTPase RsgA n=1 Tax=Bermanella marisrubri TaxID=207949 RepID=Q1N259_9GAMM|nr:small ribosomal subunit biogenesis GTPase RsgA [Bermanella marisrubri]EAT12305.1 ribosome-associated GTPase [Bermanella marisrubri]QIZ85393.1 small ribosomal subunit biogenesis GTPase RsgA [Bermanella marisrubri]
MAKRKLNKRQAWRVKKIQAEREERASKKESQIHHELEGGDLGPEQSGQVISHFGTQVLVENATGERMRCYMRTNLGGLVTGDSVAYRAGNEQGVVVARTDRQSELQRPNMYGELKTVAANINYLVIVIAPEPHAHRNLIDRYLVAAEISGIEPVLCLNKIDLLNDDNREHFAELIKDYSEIGYRFIEVSSKLDNGLAPLSALLKDRISAFVGQSGVGKSSIISQLLPDEDIRVGDLSEQTRKGRHTTTNATLFHFPSGGDLIDSPGIREYGLWHMEPEDILQGFKELQPFAGHCKFRDCKHQAEPGCAIKQAIKDGQISQRRFESYQQIIASLGDVNVRGV